MHLITRVCDTINFVWLIQFIVCDDNYCIVLMVYIICSEQYDAFVKFSHDQVERRLAESAFSCKYAVHYYCMKSLLKCSADVS